MSDGTNGGGSSGASRPWTRLVVENASYGAAKSNLGLVVRVVHVQEKLRCRCGETTITADPPAKVYDKARFGSNFMAQVVVSKCADSLPLYRQAKMYRRVGVPANDSSFGELFHRVATATKPLSARLLKLVSEKEIVQADETTQRVQDEKKTTRHSPRKRNGRSRRCPSTSRPSPRRRTARGTRRRAPVPGPCAS